LSRAGRRHFSLVKGRAELLDTLSRPIGDRREDTHNLVTYDRSEAAGIRRIDPRGQVIGEGFDEEPDIAEGERDEVHDIIMREELPCLLLEGDPILPDNLEELVSLLGRSEQRDNGDLISTGDR
jgi:hypothetical protein